MLYQMTVQVARVDEKGWRYSSGLPTFFLRDDMQMILSPQNACGVARQLVSACMPDDDGTLESVDITASGENGQHHTQQYTPEEM